MWELFRVAVSIPMFPQFVSWHRLIQQQLNVLDTTGLSGLVSYSHSVFPVLSTWPNIEGCRGTKNWSCVCQFGACQPALLRCLLLHAAVSGARRRLCWAVQFSLPAAWLSTPRRELPGNLTKWFINPARRQTSAIKGFEEMKFGGFLGFLGVSWVSVFLLFLNLAWIMNVRL